MTRLTSLALSAVLVLGSACSSVSTSHDYDPEVDFSALSSYAWMETESGDAGDSLNARRVRASVNEVLMGKGFAAVEEAPDFYVAAHLGSENKVYVSERSYGYSRRPGYIGATELDVVEYQEGSLVLDVVLGSTRELVWRGTARATVDSSATPEERAERIRAAVEELLEPFPPGRD